jgi:hypothetical protein
VEERSKKYEKPVLKFFRRCINVNPKEKVLMGILVGYTGGANDYPRFYKRAIPVIINDG